MDNTSLQHHGVLGQKWGVRRYQNYDGSLKHPKPENKFEHNVVDNNKSIKKNNDGSYTVPSGFMFNRVGKESLDVNKSGALYVSYGTNDAARYVKSLGPTSISKLLGTAGTHVQHLQVSKSLRMPSDEDVIKETVDILKKNKRVLKEFNESFYSMATPNGKITNSDLERALEDPSGYGKRMAYSVSTMFGDENYHQEAKVIYDHFRSKGYDAIPDIHDRLSGTSESAIIVINPNKLELKSSTEITKDVMRSGREYCRNIEKLKVDDIVLKDNF